MKGRWVSLCVVIFLVVATALSVIGVLPLRFSVCQGSERVKQSCVCNREKEALNDIGYFKAYRVFNDELPDDGESESVEQRVRQALIDTENIADCTVIVFGSNIVVALRIEGVFLSSEETKLLLKTEKTIIDICEGYDVFIFNSVREFYELKGLKQRLNESEDKLSIYERIAEILQDSLKACG